MNRLEITRFMKRALKLAAKGSGTTHPNPMVGAVVVSGGRVVGEGWHERPGQPHAEKIALDGAGAAARGASLFVNLEPCSHTGRTPPCSRSVIDAGIEHVYAACGDPHHLVSGRGFKALREAGIRVTEGVLAGEAEELNRAYFHYVREGTPYITLKLAATLDGRIASSRGDSKWITGEKARKAVHRLRGQVDAVMVGVGTVAADNPRLTARGVGRNIQPVKIVLDPALRTPMDSYILSKDISGLTVLVIGEDVPLTRCSAYLKKGAQILKIPVKKGSFSWKDLAGQLVDRGVLHVLVEGGGVTAAWALREGSVNRMELFLAPKFLGASGIPAVGDLGPVSLGKAVGMSLKKIRRIGEDLQVTAEPK